MQPWMPSSPPWLPGSDHYFWFRVALADDLDTER
jgi:hypothetical protein